MDSVQKKHERAVGEKFINWYNEHFGKSYTYAYCGVPDLTYGDGSNEIHLEITDAYYDQLDATIKWQNFRGKENAPNHWSGKAPDDGLIEFINTGIAEKCKKSYGNDCILVINVWPYITSVEELENKLSEIEIPETNPFMRIYLTGYFPYSTKSKGCYKCWEVSKSKVYNQK
ncbi:MAG: hypothetical protein WAK60_06950 [Sedimentisphaerales bacterium]